MTNGRFAFSKLGATEPEPTMNECISNGFWFWHVRDTFTEIRSAVCRDEGFCFPGAPPKHCSIENNLNDNNRKERNVATLNPFFAFVFSIDLRSRPSIHQNK